MKANNVSLFLSKWTETQVKQATENLKVTEFVLMVKLCYNMDLVYKQYLNYLIAKKSAAKLLGGEHSLLSIYTLLSK